MTAVAIREQFEKASSSAGDRLAELMADLDRKVANDPEMAQRFEKGRVTAEKMSREYAELLSNLEQVYAEVESNIAQYSEERLNEDIAAIEHGEHKLAQRYDEYKRIVERVSKTARRVGPKTYAAVSVITDKVLDTEETMLNAIVQLRWKLIALRATRENAETGERLTSAKDVRAYFSRLRS